MADTGYCGSRIRMDQDVVKGVNRLRIRCTENDNRIKKQHRVCDCSGGYVVGSEHP